MKLPDLQALDLLLFGIASWRLTILLVRDTGPWGVFSWLREATGVKYDEYDYPYGTNAISRGLLCVNCTSVWIGVLFVALLYLFSPIAYGLAYVLWLSMVSILIDKYF